MHPDPPFARSPPPPRVPARSSDPGCCARPSPTCRRSRDMTARRRCRSARPNAPARLARAQALMKRERHRRGADRAGLVADLFHRRALGPQRAADRGGAAGRGRAVHRHAVLRGALGPRDRSASRPRCACGRRTRTRSRWSPASCATASWRRGRSGSRRRCASSPSTACARALPGAQLVSRQPGRARLPDDQDARRDRADAGGDRRHDRRLSLDLAAGRDGHDRRARSAR